MKKVIYSLGGLILVVTTLATTWVWYSSEQQLIPDQYWSDYSTANVDKDAFGIPTIGADSWEKLYEAQGFVTASERLWQMDLIRRKTAGRLSEWFGDVALPHDLKRQKEDRIAISEKAAALLPPDEKMACLAYSKGVNQFIGQFPDKWGIEYKALRVRPEPWTCSHTLLVVMEMADQLSSSVGQKIENMQWIRQIPVQWSRFLFPNDHRWNSPLIGGGTSSGPPLPPEELWLDPVSLKDDEELSAGINNPSTIGSNNWAYRGENGQFLANDPHLGQSVPGIWFASRLRISETEWVVGAGIPGIPGIILGMNPWQAWAITNTGEDVDSLLEEELSDDETKYLDWDEQGEPVWREIDVKTFRIKIKGRPDHELKAQFTVRGPLMRIHDSWYSRQWVALRPDRLRIPTPGIAKSRSWDEFNEAINGFRIPSMNIVYMNRSGDMGYRSSGTGVLPVEKLDLPTSQRASSGEWIGLEDVSMRKRLFVPVNETGVHYLATANERIWRDPGRFHFWTDDDRSHRLGQLLETKNLSFDDMKSIQLDVASPFRQLILRWVSDHLPPDLRHPESKRWNTWDGDSRSDPIAFNEAHIIETLLTKLLLSRIKRQYDPQHHILSSYKGKMKRAWLLEVLSQKKGLTAFGLDEEETATWLFKKLMDQDHRKEHQKLNTWTAQHVLADKIPVLGQFFKIQPFDQHGSFDTINAQQARHGPSVRLIWNLSTPEKSTWSFPVGQSGHFASKHYHSFRRIWIDEKQVPIFPEKYQWGF